MILLSHGTAILNTRGVVTPNNHFPTNFRMEQTYESVLANPPCITEDLAEVHKDFLFLPCIPKINLVAISEN